MFRIQTDYCDAPIYPGTKIPLEWKGDRPLPLGSAESITFTGVMEVDEGQYLLCLSLHTQQGRDLDLRLNVRENSAVLLSHGPITPSVRLLIKRCRTRSNTVILG